MGGKGKGKKEKQARPSSSTGDELEEDGRHYGELLALHKALEHYDAEKSLEIASLKALLKAAKDDSKALNNKVVALEASLQFTQNEHEEIKDRVATCEKDQIRQENELTRQSIYSCRWNLLFFKIQENKDENCDHLVNDVLTNSLKIDEEHVNNIPPCGVHRLGKKQPKAKQPRPITVRFTCRADRDYVWRQRRHLEGSNFRMAEDLPFHVREIRKNIVVPALKKAKEDANVKASIVGDKLVVNGRRYTFNKTPTQWRKDEVQHQDVPPQEIQQQDVPAQESQQQDVPAQESQQQDVCTQEIRDPEDPTTLEIEPSQETSEIT